MIDTKFLLANICSLTLPSSAPLCPRHYRRRP